MSREVHVPFCESLAGRFRRSTHHFLFRYQKGFCEHYASSFVFMMRSVGIPTRIVTGYQGGEFSSEDQVIRVLQRDAHAWAEIWVEDEGWIRFDPTAAVAPERVELGIDEMISRGSLEQSDLPLAYHLRNTGILKLIRNQWEGLEYRWQKSVVQYQQGSQQDFMRQLFGTASYYWYQMVVLGGLIVIIIALFGLFIIVTRKSELNAYQKLWVMLEKRLLKRGFKRQACEGPADFARRVSQENPSLGDQIQPIIKQYVYSAYADTDELDHQEFKRLRKLVNQI